MECKQCGAPQADGARFCNECGAKLEHETPKEGDIGYLRGTVIRAGTVNMGAPQNDVAGPVVCIICGSFNEVKNTFRCKKCGRAHLCREHRVKITYLCEECERERRDAEERECKAAEEKARRETEERERKAAEEKSRLDAAERESKATEEKAKQEAAERERKAAEEKATQEAAERARKVHQVGDRLWVELAQDVVMEFVRVPAGKFVMGSNENPVHEVHLDEYWMGRYPVTNAQYDAFVESYGQSKPSHLGGETNSSDLENHPVVKVSWEDAKAFCEWLSRETGQKITLPMQSQWEKAARGMDGRIYPWGNESPDQTWCNFNNQVGTTTPVGQYSPLGDSPYGCADMAGNVWEWCYVQHNEDYYGKSLYSDLFFNLLGRVLCGGSWFHDGYYLRSSSRKSNPTGIRSYSLGFRCVLTLA